MIDYRMQFPDNVISGGDVIRVAAKEIRRSVGKRMLMVTESSLAGTPAAEAIRNGFEDEGVSMVMYTGLNAQSLADSAEQAAKLGHAGFVDAVIGYGRANTLSLARLTGILLGAKNVDERPGSIEIDADEILDQQRSTVCGLPFIAAPSLPFDPYLCSPSCTVIDARNRAVRYVGLACSPYIVLQDATLQFSTTRTLALISLSGAMLLAVEGLFSRFRTPISEALHVQAVERGVLALEAFASDAADEATLFDEVRRVSLISALGATRTGPGVATAAAAVVHARSSLGMSAAASALISPAVAMLSGYFPDVAVTLSRYLGAGGATSDIIESKLRELLAGAEVPLRLRDIGFDRRDSDGIAENVDATGVFGAYGGTVSVSDLTEVIDIAL